MKIYLVRHGEAVSSDVDPARPLSEKGRASVRGVADLLKPSDLKVESAFHSGKARAEQTAEILSEAIVPERGIFSREGLFPNDPVQPVKDFVESLERDVLIVGHLPFMEKLASLMISGRDNASVMKFSAGTTACFEKQPEESWRLLWSIDPAIIRS